MVSWNCVESDTSHCGLELLGDGEPHKVLAIGNHKVHFARLARDDVDTETILTEEHLAAICLLHRNGWSGSQDLVSLSDVIMGLMVDHPT